MADEVDSEVIVRVARGQHGVVAARQLSALGISADVVARRVRHGWLRRLHRGVYTLEGRAISHRGRWMAAVLAGEDGAVLSHWDAAALWKLIEPGKPPVHVTAPTHAGRARQPGIVVHRSLTLEVDGVARRDGIPVTSAPRTLMDLASTRIAERTLERTVDEAERLRLCDAADLWTIAERPRPGARRLRVLLHRHEPGTTVTRSVMEEAFLLLCRERGLPQPLVNHEVMGLRPDFFWPAAGLAVEVDGWDSHRTRRAFEDDRDRDSLLTAHGYRVLRFTWRDVTRRAGVAAERVRRVLEGRAGAGTGG